jgi:virginiamycin B lyase
MEVSVSRPRRWRRALVGMIGVSLVLPGATGAAATSSPPGSPEARRASHVRGTTPPVTYFSLTKKIRSPFWITPGPDGNMWFTNPEGDTIGRITMDGVVTEFPLAKGTHPQTITAAADGNLWFTMRQQDKIGVMDTEGNLLHQYSAQQPGATPYSIAPSPDGAVWFTDYNLEDAGVLDKVERMTLDGNDVDRFDLSTCACAPLGATYGPDGNMWFTEELGATPEMEGGAYGTVDRVSLDGKTIDRFPIDVEHTVLPQFLAPGPDGNVWFTEVAYERHNLGRVTPDGTITEFHVADTPASTNVVTTGADGDIWFTEAGTFDGDVWRMHPNGALIGTAIPVHFNPIGIALGPDGNIWFAVREGGEIGRIAAAASNRSFVLEIASGFTPAVRTVPLGRTVKWVMEAPGMHRLRDRTGMDLFDSLPNPPVWFATYKFRAAGVYPYTDGAPDFQRGKIAVHMEAPAEGDVGVALHMAWATAGAPDAAIFDVQIHRPGVPGFDDFRTGTARHGATFTPGRVGTYMFRSRMLMPGSGESGFSPTSSIHVS